MKATPASGFGLALLLYSVAVPAGMADLFFTARQQAALAGRTDPSAVDRPVTAAAPAGEVLEIQAVWQSPGGKYYAIINGQSVSASKTVGDTHIEQIGAKGIRLRAATEHQGRWMRVGERYAGADDSGGGGEAPADLQPSSHELKAPSREKEIAR